MSDDQNTNDAPISEEENVGDVPMSPLMVHRQYLKDLSFENPNAPDVLIGAKTPPEMEMNIMLDVEKLENPDHENYYEVSLQITATAKRDDKTLFIAEVVYSCAVSVQGIKDKNHHPLLFIEVPQLIFPFARQVMANVTQAGGFAPLNLSPVDFRRMYLKRFAEQKVAAEKQA